MAASPSLQIPRLLNGHDYTVLTSCYFPSTSHEMEVPISITTLVSSIQETALSALGHSLMLLLFCLWTLLFFQFGLQQILCDPWLLSYTPRICLTNIIGAVHQWSRLTRLLTINRCVHMITPYWVRAFFLLKRYVLIYYLLGTLMPLKLLRLVRNISCFFFLEFR